MKLDDLIRDARKDAYEADWSRVDGPLFERLDREGAPREAVVRRDEAPGDRRRVVWVGASFVLAAAAAALLLVHPAEDARIEGARNVGSVPAVQVGGGRLAVGVRVETSSATYFDAAGVVRWVVEPGSVFRVTRESPLVLALERGATEAQVTPVPSGEAFAVDVVASSGKVLRVAVHGTHLRVARDGDHVTVDLTEGVVSVGEPPRRGSTFGTLVTAPAHIEVDANDLGSLRVDHALAAVRTVAPPSAPLAVATQIAPASPLPHPMAPGATNVVVKPVVPSAVVTSGAVVTASEQHGLDGLRTPDAVASALQTCVITRLHTRFSTTLTMKVGDDGTIQASPAPIFNPPLPLEAQDCSANVIWHRTKLPPGEVVIPVVVAP